MLITKLGWLKLVTGHLCVSGSLVVWWGVADLLVADNPKPESVIEIFKGDTVSLPIPFHSEYKLSQKNYLDVFRNQGKYWIFGKRAGTSLLRYKHGEETGFFTVHVLDSKIQTIRSLCRENRLSCSENPIKVSGKVAQEEVKKKIEKLCRSITDCVSTIVTAVEDHQAPMHWLELYLSEEQLDNRQSFYQDLTSYPDYQEMSGSQKLSGVIQTRIMLERETEVSSGGEISYVSPNERKGVVWKEIGLKARFKPERIQDGVVFLQANIQLVRSSGKGRLKKSSFQGEQQIKMDQVTPLAWMELQSESRARNQKWVPRQIPILGPILGLRESDQQKNFVAVWLRIFPVKN